MRAELYIAAVPAGEMSEVFPPRRQAQLEETKNIPHRRQRYFVWKLLEYGLRQSLGLSMEQVDLSLDDRGRWSCDGCFFSLTHSGGAVAVAISDAPVGVDLERLDRKLHPGLPKNVLTAAQLQEFAALPEIRQKTYLLEKWCEKESLFKWKEAAPAAEPPRPCTGTVSVAEQEYCYALVTEAPHRLILLKEKDLWY